MTDFAEAARTICERLAALDRRCVAFGARKHRYRFAPPLAEADVAALERRHGLALPPAYREFVTRVGNGGAGPYYGVWPLALDADLSRPFRHTEQFEVDDDAFDAPLPGVVPLSEYGCGIDVVLVVHGPAAGEVWWDARYEGGVSPVAHRDGRRATMDTWWLEHMGGLLARFEAVAALVARGAPHEEIHALLDPTTCQLEVDEAIASVIDRDPAGTAAKSADKPWGRVCGQVDVLYAAWLAERRGA